MTGDIQRRFEGSWLPQLLLWLCLLLLAISLSSMRASRIVMDDDNLYLTYGAQSDVSRAAPLEQSLIDRVAAVPGCEQSAFRLAFRKRYAGNYGGYAAVQRAVQYVAALFVPTGPNSIVAATLVTKALFLLLMLIALGVAAARGSSREIEAAVICSFIALVGLDFASWVPAPERVEITDLLRTFMQQLSSLFVIGEAHSYFEETPRNSALLLFVIILLLKWQGHLTAAVVSLLIIASIHQTYGGLGLVLFATASAVSRPEVFATPVRRTILVVVGLVYVVRERFLERLDGWVQLACALGLIVAALFFFRGVCSARFGAWRQRHVGSWAGREIALDAAALLGFVLLVTLVSWVGDQVMQNPLTRRYVWANLPIRTLSFVRFPVFIAGFWLVLTRLKWLASARGRSSFAAACALSGLALSWVCMSKVDAHAYERLLGELDSNLRRPRAGSIFEPFAEERRIYAYLTMVAAGQVDPAKADARIVGKREIHCR